MEEVEKIYNQLSEQNKEILLLVAKSMNLAQGGEIKNEET